MARQGQAASITEGLVRFYEQANRVGSQRWLTHDDMYEWPLGLAPRTIRNYAKTLADEGVLAAEYVFPNMRYRLSEKQTTLRRALEDYEEVMR